MRMVKSLLENQTLFLEKYLHELIPAVTTCIVSRQLCTRPDVDNHWALRDFASRLMGNICKNFNTSTNNIQTRVTRMFSEAMQKEKPLVSYYGAIAALQELGAEVIKAIVLPNLKSISQRIDQANSDAVAAAAIVAGSGNVEKIAAKNIHTLVLKSICPVIKNERKEPDVAEEYKKDYGSLGVFIHQQVVRLRQTATTTPAAVRPQQAQIVQGVRPAPLTMAAVPGGATYLTPGTPQQGARMFVLQQAPVVQQQPPGQM